MDKRTIIKTTIILFATGLLFFTNSCCTEKKCSDNYISLQFHNYTAADLDTVVLCRYSNNSNYTALADSIKVDVSQNGGSFDLSLNIDLGSNYKIYIISIKQVHKIFDFQTKKVTCNTCLLIANDKYSQIKSYQLNGQTFSGNGINIYK